MSFTFGSDPEFMLAKNGRICSAIGIVPGTKDKRHKIGDNCFYYDNVLAECTITPSSSKEEAIVNFRDCLQKFAALVDPCKLVPIASHNYPTSELQHKAAFEIGCKREACAYALIEPEPPEEIFLSTGLRVAGGHIHIGAKVAQDAFGCLSLIRMLDLFIGVPSIFMDHDKTSKKRKEAYGKAGRFRQPKHGAEYRSISNFWLASPELVGVIYDICAFTVAFVEEGRHKKYWFIDEDRLDDDDAWNDENFDPADCHQCTGYNVNKMRSAIDTMNKRQGRDLMKLIGTILPKNLFSEIGRISSKKSNYDMYKEWNLS